MCWYSSNRLISMWKIKQAVSVCSCVRLPSASYIGQRLTLFYISSCRWFCCKLRNKGNCWFFASWWGWKIFFFSLALIENPCYNVKVVPDKSSLTKDPVLCRIVIELNINHKQKHPLLTWLTQACSWQVDRTFLLIQMFVVWVFLMPTLFVCLQNAFKMSCESIRRNYGGGSLLAKINWLMRVSVHVRSV